MAALKIATYQSRDALPLQFGCWNAWRADSCRSPTADQRQRSVLFVVRLRVLFQSMGRERANKGLFVLRCYCFSRLIGISVLQAFLIDSLTWVVWNDAFIGRSGNQWLSPPGCAMFSFNFAIPPGTLLSDNVGFIQHILCVAMVDGVCSLHGLKARYHNYFILGRIFLRRKRVHGWVFHAVFA